METKIVFLLNSKKLEKETFNTYLKLGQPK